jgi:hypothetical protein
MNFILPAELLARMAAVAQGRTHSAMVREALIQWVQQEERKLGLRQ